MPAILSVLRLVWPYLLAASVGWGAAWHIQGLRITSAKQEFVTYKLQISDAETKRQQEDDEQRAKSAKEYAHLSELLDNEINQGVVYRRCVDAGRCGVRKQSCPVQAVAVPPASGANEASTDAIPIRQEPTEALAGECAETVLRLNRLQAAIEAQAGY